MAVSDLEQLTREIAAQHHLDEILMCAMVAQESGWNPWLSRYEPAFFVRYVDKSSTHLEVREFCRSAPFTVSFDTELRERAFSRGLLQLIGQTAREQGFEGPLPRLHDPRENLDLGCRFFKKLMDRAAGDVDKALLRWNGGDDPHYPSRVKGRMRDY